MGGFEFVALIGDIQANNKEGVGKRGPFKRSSLN